MMAIRPAVFRPGDDDVHDCGDADAGPHSTAAAECFLVVPRCPEAAVMADDRPVEDPTMEDQRWPPPLQLQQLLRQSQRLSTMMMMRNCSWSGLMAEPQTGLHSLWELQRGPLALDEQAGERTLLIPKM